MRCGIAVTVFMAATVLVNKVEHFQNESSFSHTKAAVIETADQSLRQKFAAVLSQKMPALKMELPPADQAANCYIRSTLFTTGMACAPDRTIQQTAALPVPQQDIDLYELDVTKESNKEKELSSHPAKTEAITKQSSRRETEPDDAVTVHQALAAPEAITPAGTAEMDQVSAPSEASKPSVHSLIERTELAIDNFEQLLDYYAERHPKSDEPVIADRASVDNTPFVVDTSNAVESSAATTASKFENGNLVVPPAIDQLANAVSNSAAAPAVDKLYEHKQAHSIADEQTNNKQAATSNEVTAPLGSKYFASRLKDNKFPYSFSAITLNSLDSESESVNSAAELSFTEPSSIPPVSASDSKIASMPKEGFMQPIEESRLVIMIDPGHGGSDVGTIGPEGTYEKQITLDIAKRVQIMASLHEDIKVVLSRSIDDGLSRAGRINAIKRQNPDFLLSLHLNNIPQKELVLVETYYTSKQSSDKSTPLTDRHNHKHHNHDHDLLMKVSDAERSDSTIFPQQSEKQIEWSRKFATAIQSKVFAAVQSRNPRAIDAGVKDDNFYVLTRTGIPGALVEMTCLSNSDEERRLGTESYRNELAVSLMDAIRTMADMRLSEGAI